MSLLPLLSQTDLAAQHNLLPSPSHPLSASLDYAITNSNKHSIPRITISALQGQYLAIQSQLISAKDILEVGTLGGYSTIWFASTGAKVTSLEINPKHRDVALENVANAGYKDSVEIILGSAHDSLAKLKQEGKVFDLIFIDADWESQGAYFTAAVDLLRPKGCIYVDNVVRELFEEIEEGKDIVKDSMLATVGKDDRVVATMVTMASTHKGKESESLDGFVLAVKK